ncbi:hypothetical protein [Actinomadura rubrisoli]|uniref:Uncharacterized protein n=1 Tax=Actinomadura rubrisoli TaxID=2530368 RepID=A0A4R5C7Q4_9ACTN|nr:hypothetical protein [Actinomadura rubrisoli]TDD95841.1 hypothetical protein E1298_04150 [Actinomadura rubrisoli]
MGTTAGAQPPTSPTIDFHTLGRTLDDATVDRWELKAARRALMNLKTLAGGQRMMELLAEQIDAGDRFHRELVAASGGTYRESRADLTVRGLSGTDLAAWFRSQLTANGFEDRVFFAAHPEHYVQPPNYTGLVETIGGHTTRFKVALGRELPPPVRAYADPSYPLTLGTASFTLDDGTPVAYALHQARDTDTGADVALRIIYPSAAPDSMIEGHCEHLAIEFRNWIRNAAAAAR